MREDAPPDDACLRWDPWSMPMVRREMPIEAYRATQTEAEFMGMVREAAERLGWVVVHFPAMLANPSGWPDLIMFRDGQVLIAELKTGHGKLGPKQWEWIGRLAAVGIHVQIWRPEDWETIEATLKGEPPSPYSPTAMH